MQNSSLQDFSDICKIYHKLVMANTFIKQLLVCKRAGYEEEHEGKGSKSLQDRAVGWCLEQDPSLDCTVVTQCPLATSSPSSASACCRAFMFLILSFVAASACIIYGTQYIFFLWDSFYSLFQHLFCRKAVGQGGVIGHQKVEKNLPFFFLELSLH